MELSPLQLFLLLLAGLYIAWTFTGGPSRTENADKPFLEQPAPIEGGQAYTLKQLREGTRP